jgi:hypothetical protein
LADSDPVTLKKYKAKAYKNMDYHENSQIYDIMGLAICQWPFINWEPIGQLVDIDVWPQKSQPIDQFA